MKLTTRFFTQGLLCLFICFISATAIYGQNNDFQHKKDSLLKVIASTKGEEKLEVYFKLTRIASYPNEELRLQYVDDFIREAKKQNNKKYEHLAYRIELTCLMNSLRYDEFMQKANKYLPFFKENGFKEGYYQQYSYLITIFSIKGNKKRAIEECNQLYTEAKQENCTFGIVQSTLLMSHRYSEEGRYKDAEKYAQETIKNALILIKEKPKESVNYDLAIEGYIRLTNALYNQNKIDECYLLMPAWRKMFTDFEKTIGNPHLYLAYYYRAYAMIYLAKEELDKAELHCDSIELTVSTDLIMLIFMYDTKSEICEKRKEYSNAIDWIDKSINIGYKYGVATIISRLKVKARLSNKIGRTEEIYSILNTAIELNDSLRLLENNAQLDEIRTQYEVDKHVAEKEHFRNYFLFAIGGCILLTIALGIWIYLNRKITKKNRILAHQIKELTTRQEGQINEILTKTSFVPEEEKPETVDSDLCVESRMDKLCIAIRDLLLKEKIYRDPDITQDLVIEQLRTNRRLFSEAFEYCFNMKFNDYINSLRLKDAVVLLEQSDLSIEEISYKVGFGAARTFRRQFSEKYGISPKNYRDENVTKIS